MQDDEVACLFFERRYPGEPARASFNDRVDVGTRNPSDGVFTGKLKLSTTMAER